MREGFSVVTEDKEGYGRTEEGIEYGTRENERIVESERRDMERERRELRERMERLEKEVNELRLGKKWDRGSTGEKLNGNVRRENKEVDEWKGRVKELERRWERKEREKRRRNIVVKRIREE